MKTLILLAICLLFTRLSAQETAEKEIRSEVSEVTVFLNGAQLLHRKTVELPKGITIIRFIALSPFIDAKSVQVKAEGNITVLSVNHQQNYLDTLSKSKELSSLVNQLEIINEKITLENTHLEIIREELAFLQDNRDIGGKNEQVNITSLQQASDFYGKKLTTLKMEEIERNKALSDLTEQRLKIENQINQLTGQTEYPAGEIVVKADAGQSGSYPFEITYVVANAGWFPSYDIRAENINEPVQLIYKANVKQDTKTDWNNVKIKFSSSDPNVSGVAPELKTYFLDYYTAAPVYNRTANSVTGKVFDSNGQPLPGATIQVQGSTIGTVTDIQGSYSLTLPNNAAYLTYSFIGYETKTMPVTGSIMNVALEENVMTLDETVVTGYAIRMEAVEEEEDFSRGSTTPSLKIRGMQSLAIPAAQVERQTAVDFEINTPYTVKSDNKNYTVDMAVYELPAFYQYYSVPKIDKDAFLIANITDWEKYNLLEGEANVFFENTYVGKTLLDVRYASDTMEISLGRDKQVSVKREKTQDYTESQLLGSKKEEFRTWKTTVKNNKSQPVNMIILDQVPVSTMEEIEVIVRNISGAKHNTETGEIKWEFTLQPAGQNEFELNYSVRYPKNRNLVIE